MGKVYLVGTGPGDPELLTVKGVMLFMTIKVQLYSALYDMQ
jgi:uroporphyrin-III C-methyltransferase